MDGEVSILVQIEYNGILVSSVKKEYSGNPLYAVQVSSVAIDEAKNQCLNGLGGIVGDITTGKQPVRTGEPRPRA